jgi:adenosylmethionine-8-amino-7-oxononanoate aminotransferase
MFRESPETIARWLERDESSVWHPYTARPFTGPRGLFVRAEGAYVIDAEGRRFLDATSSW